MNRTRNAMKPHRSMRMVRLFSAAWPLLCIAAALSPLAAAGTARGGIVVDHPPHNTGGPGADTEFLILEQPFWQYNADDFVLSQPAVIRQVNFWGFHGGTFDDFPETVPDVETFRIRFYHSRPDGTAPDEGQIIFEESTIQPMRSETGRIVLLGPAPLEFRYDAPLSQPVSLDAGIQYWIEVTQLGIRESLFRWEVSLGGDLDFAFINPNISDWRQSASAGDLAFQLSTVPEPATVLLLGTMFVLASVRCHKARRMFMRFGVDAGLRR